MSEQPQIKVNEIMSARKSGLTAPERTYFEKMKDELVAIARGRTPAQIYEERDVESRDKYQAKKREITRFLLGNKKDRREMMQIPEGFMSYEEIKEWLSGEQTADGRTLEAHFRTGSFEKLIDEQEAFYKKRYGSKFRLDRCKIMIEESRKKRIKAGIENGCVNFPLLVVTPDELAEEEEEWTEAQYAYYRLMKPLKEEGAKILEKTGRERWTKLTLEECLDRYIPVEVADFEGPAFAPQGVATAGKEELTDKNWETVFARIIAKKPSAPKQKAGKVELIFTDERIDIPQEQEVINQDGEAKINTKNFVKIIRAKVRVLTPEQWIALASQVYSRENKYLARSTYDWMMAVLKNKNVNNDPRFSAAIVYSLDGFNLCSDADSAVGGRRWRVGL